MAAERPWRPARDGVQVDVRLTPRGGRDAVDGVEMLANGRAILKIRVRAAPHGGEANGALMRLVAKSLGVAPSQVRLLSGTTGRIKRLVIAGDGGALVAALEKIAG